MSLRSVTAGDGATGDRFAHTVASATQWIVTGTAEAHTDCCHHTNPYDNADVTEECIDGPSMVLNLREV